MFKLSKKIFGVMFALTFLLQASVALAGPCQDAPPAGKGGRCTSSSCTASEVQSGTCGLNGGATGKCCVPKAAAAPTAPSATPGGVTTPLLKNSSDPKGAKYSSDACLESGDCQLNDMLVAGVRFTEIILGLVGSLSLLMFVYGGFTMLISQGASDKVTKGKGIITAAVVGLVIVFASYAIIDYTLGKLGYQTNNSAWYTTK